MLIPYGTDAPIYHRPIATVSMIVANIAMFVATGLGQISSLSVSRYDWLMIEFDRINPLQWITGAFMHASWIHLIGNMIFLWCFGLVIEGKLGWRRFLLLYLALCLGSGAIAQIPMFLCSSPISGCLGASGVIFGLIAVALCWAPQNNMHCVLMWSFYMPYPIDVSVFGLGLFYGFKELIPLLVLGFPMSTPLLHILGMVVGFPVAIYVLKRNWVDCEGWDVLSRWPEFSRNQWLINPLLLMGQIVRQGDSPRSPKVPSAKNQTTRNPSAKIRSQVSNDTSQYNAMQQILNHPDKYNPPKTATVTPPPPIFDPSDAQRSSASRMRDRRHDALVAFQQSVTTGKIKESRAAFARISEHWGTHGMNVKLLVNYAELLVQHGKHLESLTPLKVLVSRRASCANQACLRIASIQLQYSDDLESATATLRQMRSPMSPAIRDRQQQLANLIRKRFHEVSVDQRTVS